MMTRRDTTGSDAAARRSSNSDAPHRDAAVEEWVFAAWASDATVGVISGHRIVGPTAWYWAAVVRKGRPLLHIADFQVPVRADPFIVKGEALWAEHHCVAPAEQWSIGNETYASALDDPDDALGRAYGVPTAVAFDLEWYSVGDRYGIDDGDAQPGVVHGSIEILGEAHVELVEVPAHRWHRWRSGGDGPLGPLELSDVVAHTGLRAPFAFPDGTVDDLVLTPAGWGRRVRRVAVPITPDRGSSPA